MIAAVRSLKSLYDIHGITSGALPDAVTIVPDMSGLEDDPRNDWLHVALSEFRHFRATRGEHIRSAGFIGSANGIDVIAALRLFSIERLTVTDIVPALLPAIESNIRANTASNRLPKMIRFAAGRDCEPLEEPCDLIYANLPLVMVDTDQLGSELATTTLTDARAYAHLQTGPDDLLARWSLLPQLGLLLSAKERLTPGGAIITLIGGRISDAAIEQCFERAGMDHERGTVAIMRQSDEQYLAQYADYEQRLGGDTFAFYDEAEASRILAAAGCDYPSTLTFSPEVARTVLEPALLSASQAWERVRQGHHVAHLAYGFLAVVRQ